MLLQGAVMLSDAPARSRSLVSVLSLRNTYLISWKFGNLAALSNPATFSLVLPGLQLPFCGCFLLCARLSKVDQIFFP